MNKTIIAVIMVITTTFGAGCQKICERNNTMKPNNQ
jgi:hypothetical protein